MDVKACERFSQLIVREVQDEVNEVSNLCSFVEAMASGGLPMSYVMLLDIYIET